MIFVAETLTVFGIGVLLGAHAGSFETRLAGAIVEGVFLTIATGLPIYFFVIKPYLDAGDRAEQAMREGEERFRAVVSNSPTKIHIKDLEGRYILINPLAERLFGVTEAEAKGKTTHEIFPEKQAESFAEHDQTVRETGQTMEREEEWLVDGEVRTYLTVKFPVLDSAGRVSGVGAIGTDITEHRQAEQALRESQLLYQNLIQLAPVSIFVQTGSDAKIAFANDRGVRLLGAKSRDEVIGKSLTGYLHPDYHDEAQERTRRALAGEPIETVVEGKVLRADNSVVNVERSVAACTYQGQPAIQSVLHDITERKAAEEVIMATQEEAQLANRAKSEFLANMSHELRTPLNAIIGFAELIRDQHFGPLGNLKYGDYARDIADSGQHLLDLISDILDLSKIESGRVELHEEDTEVAEIVEACMRLTRERARENDVRLVFEPADGVPPVLRVDRRMLKQILVNLISNAVKFTPPGGQVTIKTWQDRKTGYALQVADTGIGIAAEDIETALSRFGQIDGTLSRKSEGTGLGLPLTKTLVELHGGVFDLQSDVGKGTVVTMRFPERRIVRQAEGKSRSPAA